MSQIRSTGESGVIEEVAEADFILFEIQRQQILSKWCKHVTRLFCIQDVTEKHETITDYLLTIIITSYYFEYLLSYSSMINVRLDSSDSILLIYNGYLLSYSSMINVRLDSSDSTLLIYNG